MGKPVRKKKGHKVDELEGLPPLNRNAAGIDVGSAVMRHILSPRTSHAISQLSSQISDRTNEGRGIGYLLV
jgi:hypothetical protein